MLKLANKYRHFRAFATENFQNYIFSAREDITLICY